MYLKNAYKSRVHLFFVFIPFKLFNASNFQEFL
jgi:hypothetical protein